MENQAQLSVNFNSEISKNAVKRVNPFLISERVKRELYRRGYSHIFNYPAYQEYKQFAKGLSGNEMVIFITELFIENTEDPSDYDEYIN